MKKNVLILLDSLNIGGAEILCLDLLNNFKSDKFKLFFVATSKGELYEKFRSKNNFHFIGRKSYLDLRMLFKLRKFIKGNKIEIIHSNRANDTLYAFISSFLLNVKIVCSIHGYNNKKYEMKYFLFLMKFTSLNLFVSNQFFLNYLKKYPSIKNNNNKVLYNGIDLNRIKYKTNYNSKPFIIGMVGNFVRAKDHLTVCKAINKLKDEGYELKCLFAGKKNQTQPEVYEECVEYCKEKKLEKYIEFKGLVKNIKNFINELDIMIFSTKEDSFGLVLLEGVLSGVPVIASDIDVIKEVTFNGKIATLFRAGDYEDLSYKLKSFFIDQNSLIDKINEKRKKAIKEYGIENYITNLENHYLSLYNDEKENIINKK